MFGDEKKIGKSTLTDLQEAKRTYLIWYAFNNAGAADKKRLKSILSRKKVTKKDLLSARRIINQTGALNAARKDIKRLVNKSGEILGSSSIKQPYKKSLRQLAENIVIA